MRGKYHPGDFVACYITNSSVHEELLVWGMVIGVSPTLEDILVLDKRGNSQWWPSKRWRPLCPVQEEQLDLIGHLA
jgi:hypothetical protein